MKSVLTIFLITLAAVHAKYEPGLLVRFGYGHGVGSSFFYDIPKNKSQAVSRGYQQHDRPEGPMPQLELYCGADCVVCVLIDDTESTAGVQIGVNENQVSNVTYDWNDQGYTYWTTNVNGTATNFWTLNAYFVSEETLAKSKEERMALRMSSNETLLEGFVLATGFGKNLTYIYSNSTDLVNNNTQFTKQGCVPWMGYHYYYNMSSTTECSSTTLYPWFPLERCGQVIALGLAMYCDYTANPGQTYWFENPPQSFVLKSVPDGPQCVYDNAVYPGIVTIHIYFISEPWLVSCFDLLDCYI